MRYCFSQRQNRTQTFETLAKKDKKDISFVDLSITLMLAAIYPQHNLARLMKYNAHTVAMVCDATKL